MRPSHIAAAFRLILTILISLAAILASPSAQTASAITTTTNLDQGMTAAGLVAALLAEDSGIEVSNIQYTGANSAAGTFSGGADSIGFESGLVLSSGVISGSIGNYNVLADTQHNTAGDADLDDLVGVGTHDAAVLEFDFVPEGDHIQIIYVFGSEEYPEYVGQYNDGFALFVNGVNQAVIEKVDGTLIPVTINSINNENGSPNSEYYRDNESGGINTTMNGLTTVLSLKAAVNRDETNHIKIAIADAGDAAYDSNVFLKMQSLTSREADLSLEMTVDTYTPAVDGSVTFSLALHNAGPYNAAPLVKDLLPEGLSFVSATPGQGSYDQATGIWNVGTVSAGSSASLQIVATVNTDQKVENIAQVIESDRFDPDSTPNNNIPGEDDQKAIRLGPNNPPTALVLSLNPVSEDSAAGHEVGILSVTDPDVGDSHVYSLLDDAGGDFVLDNNRVEVAEGSSLDYESAASRDITVKATDAGGLSIVQTFNIPIENANEAPVISLPEDQASAEDTALVFSSAEGNQISIADPDAGSQPLEVTLTVGQGTLTLGGLTGLSFSAGDGAADASMTFTGSQTDINSALNGLSFKPNQDYNGLASLQVIVNDQGNTGYGNPLESSGSIGISIDPRNDAPLLTDLELDGLEDTALNFSLAGFESHFSDADTSYQGDSLVKVKVLTLPEDGELQLAGVPIAADLEIPAGDLDDLVFLPIGDWHGETTFSWNASDGTAYAAAPAAAILSITPANDPPTSISLSHASLDENQSPPALVGILSSADPDSGDSHTYSLISGEGDGDNAAFNIHGNQLESVLIFNYEDQQTYSIRVQTQDSGGLTYAQSFTVQVNNLNEAPQLNLPPAQSTDEDTPLIFSTAAGNPLSVTDVDAGDEELLVNLTAVQGSLTLSGNEGLTFSVGDGSEDTSLAFSGSIASLNDALDGLIFLPNPDYNGPASLQIAVDDQGHSGPGGALNVTDTLSITVLPGNDPPINTSAPSISGKAHTGQTLAAEVGEWNDDTDLAPGTLAFTYQWQRAEAADGLNAIDIPGASSSTYTATATDNGKYLRVLVTAADNGEGEPASLSATAASDWIPIANASPAIAGDAAIAVSMDEDSDPLDFNLTLSASDPDGDELSWSVLTPANHGAVIAGGVGTNLAVDYTPDPDYNGQDTFTIQVSDGLGGIDSVTVNVVVLPRNDPPVNTTAPAIVGSPKSGQILVAEAGEWNDATDLQPGTLTFTYQWQIAEDADGLNAVDIAGASGYSYLVTPENRGKYLRVQVTATDDGEGEPNSRSASAASTWLLVENSSPTITQGAEAAVIMDEDSNPLAFDLTIGATDPDDDELTWSLIIAPTHGTAAADGAGNELPVNYTPEANFSGGDSFTIQVSDGSGSTDTITVNVTVRPRNDPPVNASAPTIQGSGHPGQPLAVLPGDWDDGFDQQPGELDFSYQWQRASQADGSDAEVIPAATGLNYIPSAADVGWYIGAKVTAQDNGEGLPASQHNRRISLRADLEYSSRNRRKQFAEYNNG